jgi:hypothetical protein
MMAQKLKKQLVNLGFHLVRKDLMRVVMLIHGEEKNQDGDEESVVDEIQGDAVLDNERVEIVNTN